MSEFVLPTQRRKAVDYNPRLMVLFGKPKSGKSTLMASLDNNLIIDLEDGYRALEVMTVAAHNAQEIFKIKKAIEEKNKENGNKPFYRFITIDNASRLEEMSLAYAKKLYRNTPMGTYWGFKKDRSGNFLKDTNGNYIDDPTADVRQLPNGGGYLYVRLALKEMVTMFRPLCETLILICHVKDKMIKKDDVETTEMQVDMGKLYCPAA